MKAKKSKTAKPKPAAKRTKTKLSSLTAEFVADTFGPPTPVAKQRLLRAKRKRSQQQVGTGSKTISVTASQLDKMSAEFDREFVVDTFSPPTPAAKKRLQRAKRKPGRPRVGAGSKPISVTVEITLLSKIDRIAKRRNTSRAKLVARGLRTILKEEEAAAN